MLPAFWKNVAFGRFPGFARLPVWWKQHIDEDEYGPVLTKFCAPGPHVASENNQGSSHPYLNIGCPDDGYAKLKMYVSELIR